MNDQDKNDPEIMGKQLLIFVQLLHNVTDIIWDKQNYTAPRELFYYAIFMKFAILT